MDVVGNTALQKTSRSLEVFNQYKEQHYVDILSPNYIFKTLRVKFCT